MNDSNVFVSSLLFTKSFSVWEMSSLLFIIPFFPFVFKYDTFKFFYL